MAGGPELRHLLQPRLRRVGSAEAAALVELEFDALFVTTPERRLVRVRTSFPRPHPYVVVAAAPGAMVWATSERLDRRVAARIDGLLDAEDVPAILRPEWTPETLGEIREVLGSVDVESALESGPSFVVDALPGPADQTEGFEVLTSAEDDLAGLEFDTTWHPVAPWAVAVDDGRVIGVCTTSRLMPHAVECGVQTAEGHRGRGIGSAVVRAWTHLVEDRTIFYSTTDDNVASQRIAEGLGFRRIAQWCRLREPWPV